MYQKEYGYDNNSAGLKKKMPAFKAHSGTVLLHLFKQLFPPLMSGQEHGHETDYSRNIRPY